jgi:hypothetical protein
MLIIRPQQSPFYISDNDQDRTWDLLNTRLVNYPLDHHAKTLFEPPSSLHALSLEVTRQGIPSQLCNQERNFCDDVITKSDTSLVYYLVAMVGVKHGIL